MEEVDDPIGELRGKSPILRAVGCRHVVDRGQEPAMLTSPQLGDVDRGNRVSCPLALLTYGLVSGHRAHL
jgi:hypothetical protein